MSTPATSPPRAGGTRGREEKHDERRTQLAISALITLGELGYARTSLREIAQNSEFSHGVVHYYFANKIELIIHCVRYYKTQCVERYDAVIADSRTAEELSRGFTRKLVETLVEESPMHRLWYDLRTQSMFEEELRTDVLDIDHSLEVMIWDVIERFSELSGRSPAFDSPTCYSMLDGLFENALLRHLSGDQTATSTLSEQVEKLLPRLLGS